jgi:hypothetical protein
MKTTNTAKPSASPYINAVCTAVEDMGVMTTQYGKKPMLKFTFEIDELNQYGEKRRLTRLFHKHFHPLSALSVAAKAWCDRDLAAEEENIGDVDLQSFEDTPAKLKIEPGAEYNGKRYDNITEILPLDDDDDAANENCELQEPKDTQ